MKWMRMVMVCGAMVAGSGERAMACLNDTQVRAAEDQFRSGYERKVQTPTALRLPWNVYLPGAGALALGLGMISFVSVRALRRKR